jgi:hypothetical protein
MTHEFVNIDEAHKNNMLGICEIVAGFFDDTTIDDVLQRYNRIHLKSTPAYVAVYFILECYKCKNHISYKMICELMNYKQHGSLIHIHKNTIPSMMFSDKKFRKLIEQIEIEVNNYLKPKTNETDI